MGENERLWQDYYIREPLDFKLTLILFMRRLWVVILSGLAGAALLAVIHYLVNVVTNKECAYRADYKFYVDYYKDENGLPLHYFNQSAWDEIVKTDVVTEKIKTLLPKDTFIWQVNKENLQKHITATLYSDNYVVTVTAIAGTSDDALILGKALKEAFFILNNKDFGIKSIEILTDAETASYVRDIQGIVRAGVLGLLLAGILAAAAVILRIVWDDAIYIPETFERRYKIPVLGFACKSGSKVKGNEARTLPFRDINVNVPHILGKCNNIAIIKSTADTGTEILLQNITEILGKTCEVKVFEPLFENPESTTEIRTFDGVVLAIKSGVTCGKKIQHTLSLLGKQECNLKAAVLVDINTAVIKQYYFRLKSPSPER